MNILQAYTFGTPKMKLIVLSEHILGFQTPMNDTIILLAVWIIYLLLSDYILDPPRSQKEVISLLFLPYAVFIFIPTSFNELFMYFNTD